MNSQMYKDTHLGNLETTGLVPIIGLPFLDLHKWNYTACSLLSG